MQIGACCAQPAAAADIAVEGGEALLLVAVDIVGQRVAGLLHCLEKRCEQWVRRRPAFQHQRTVVAAILALDGQAGLHAFEIGQAVGVVPVLHAGVAGPSLVVERVAALENHAVDAAGAAQDFAATMGDTPAVHERFWLGRVQPVIVAGADRIGEGGRHMDEDIPPGVGPARFEEQHTVARVRAEAVGQHAPRRAAPDDDGVNRLATWWT